MHLFIGWKKALRIYRSGRRNVLTWNLKSISNRLKTIVIWFLRSGNKYVWDLEDSFRKEVLLHSDKHMFSHPTLLTLQQFLHFVLKVKIYLPVNQLHNTGCGPILSGVLVVYSQNSHICGKTEKKKSINALRYQYNQYRTKHQTIYTKEILVKVNSRQDKNHTQRPRHKKKRTYCIWQQW